MLFCRNAAGTEKLKPLVTGRSAKPRCFKGMHSLPADYVANKKAWMMADLFQAWLSQVEKMMRLQNCKIALVVSNCDAHKLPVLEHVNVIFLPPNCTSPVAAITSRHYKVCEGTLPHKNAAENSAKVGPQG